MRKARDPLLADWPLPQPSDWAEYVNLPQTEAEVESIRRCLHRGSPYGDALWTEQTAEQLGLQSTLRRRGCPRKDNTQLPNIRHLPNICACPLFLLRRPLA
jgi:hypothetical protein